MSYLDDVQWGAIVPENHAGGTVQRGRCTGDTPVFP